jgi:hypothetical protein
VACRVVFLEIPRGLFRASMLLLSPRMHAVQNIDVLQQNHWLLPMMRCPQITTHARILCGIYKRAEPLALTNDAMPPDHYACTHTLWHLQARTHHWLLPMMRCPQITTHARILCGIYKRARTKLRLRIVDVIYLVAAGAGVKKSCAVKKEGNRRATCATMTTQWGAQWQT